MKKGEIVEVSRGSVLKEIFEKHSEDTITYDQLYRILEPVLQMISEGRFDRRYKYKVSNNFILFGSLIMLTMLTLIITLLN